VDLVHFLLNSTSRK